MVSVGVEEPSWSSVCTNRLNGVLKPVKVNIIMLDNWQVCFFDVNRKAVELKMHFYFTSFNHFIYISYLLSSGFWRYKLV